MRKWKGHKITTVRVHYQLEEEDLMEPWFSISLFFISDTESIRLIVLCSGRL